VGVFQRILLEGKKIPRNIFAMILSSTAGFELGTSLIYIFIVFYMLVAYWSEEM
jgi:hypothetical protein